MGHQKIIRKVDQIIGIMDQIIGKVDFFTLKKGPLNIF